MPTNRTKRTRERAGALDHWKLDDLMTGQCFLGAGYRPANNRNGCNHWSPAEWAEVRAAMRADWMRHGRAILAALSPDAPKPWALAEWGEPA